MFSDQISGVVLAGGKSSRLGTEKGLMLWRGRPLIEHVLDNMKCCCSEIYISSNSRSYDYLGHQVFSDIFPDCGPMGGVHAAFAYAPAQHLLMVPCDMPLLDVGLLKRLTANMLNYQAVIPEVNGQPYPVVGYYHRSVLSTLENNLRFGKLKMIRFVETLTFLKLAIEPEHWFKFININTLNDLELIGRC